MSQSRPVSHYAPQPGSVLITSGDSKLAKITIDNCSDPDQKWRTGTHAGVFFNASWLVETRRRGGGLRGLLRATVQPVPWGVSQRQMLNSGTHWIVLSPEPALSGVELITFQKHVLDTINKKYALLELPLQLLDERREDRTGERSYFYRKLGNLIPNNGICAKWTATPFVQTHLWPEHLLLDDPDHQLDWMISTIKEPYKGRRWVPTSNSDRW